MSFCCHRNHFIQIINDTHSKWTFKWLMIFWNSWISGCEKQVGGVLQRRGWRCASYTAWWHFISEPRTFSYNMMGQLMFNSMRLFKCTSWLHSSHIFSPQKLLISCLWSLAYLGVGMMRPRKLKTCSNCLLHFSIYLWCWNNFLIDMNRSGVPYQIDAESVSESMHDITFHHGTLAHTTIADIVPFKIWANRNPCELNCCLQIIMPTINHNI